MASEYPRDARGVAAIATRNIRVAPAATPRSRLGISQWEPRRSRDPASEYSRGTGAAIRREPEESRRTIPRRRRRRTKLQNLPLTPLRGRSPTPREHGEMAKHRRRRGRGEKTLRGRGSRGAGCAQRPWASGGGGTSSGLRVARAAAAAIPQKFTELTSDACARSPTPREHGEMTKRRKRCGPETAFARGGPRAAPVGVWGRRASPRQQGRRPPPPRGHTFAELASDACVQTIPDAARARRDDKR